MTWADLTVHDVERRCKHGVKRAMGARGCFLPSCADNLEEFRKRGAAAHGISRVGLGYLPS